MPIQDLTWEAVNASLVVYATFSDGTVQDVTQEAELATLQQPADTSTAVTLLAYSPSQGVELQLTSKVGGMWIHGGLPQGLAGMADHSTFCEENTHL